MIVVKVEVHPNGSAAHARELHRLEIRNVGGTVQEGQYLATLGDRTATVQDHPRLESDAVQLLANALHALGISPIRAPEPFDLSRIEPFDQAFDDGGAHD